MAARSVISVDVQDGAWKAFERSIQRHQIALKSMPGQWGAVGAGIGKAGNAATKFVASIVETGRQLKNANTAAGKMTLALKASDRVMSSLGRGTLSVARNLKDATKSLLSWASLTGLFSGLLGAGGLFGIARLASSVSAGQTSAAQAGTTYGGEKAAQIGYGQILGGAGGVTNLLKQMAKDQESGGLMFRKLSQYGLTEDKWKGKDTAMILPELLKALQKMQAQSPAGVKALVAEKFLPEGIDFNTLMGISAKNLSMLEKETKARRGALELSKPTQDSWSSFQRQLEYAGAKIENVFIKGLTPLLPALTKFSDALAKAISTIISSDAVKGLVKKASTGLDTFAKYLTSKQFSEDFDSFIDKIKQVGEAFVAVAEFINKWIPGAKSPEEKIREKAEIKRFAAATPAEQKKIVMEQYSGRAKYTEGIPTRQTFEFVHKHMNDSGDSVNVQTYAAAAAYWNIR